jgi:tetratricopeptide (TPR) repeat protein
MNQEQNEQRLNQLNNRLIELYNSGQYREAIPIGKQARQLAADIWGPTHPKVATSCNNLALLYETQNRLAEAEPLYLEAIDIDRKALPKDHPSLATGLNNLALLLAKTKRPLAAFKLMLQASKIDETNIQRYFGSSSESDVASATRGAFASPTSIVSDLGSSNSSP